MFVTHGISSGVKVEVKPIFRKDLSDPEKGSFVYNYHVTIQNENKFPVQLLKRKWIIRDSMGSPKIVEGDGVIGKQPLLFAKETFEYISGAEIKGFMGEMYGNYIFKNNWDNSLFEVVIPKFKLQYPPSAN